MGLLRRGDGRGRLFAHHLLPALRGAVEPGCHEGRSRASAFVRLAIFSPSSACGGNPSRGRDVVVGYHVVLGQMSLSKLWMVVHEGARTTRSRAPMVKLPENGRTVAAPAAPALRRDGSQMA